MYDNIDFKKLRYDLKIYYGSAIIVTPIDIMNVIEIERCSNERLIEIALKNKFDLEDYKKYQKSR